MNRAEFRRQLLETLVADLAEVGYFVTAARREQMHRLLERLDELASPQDVEQLWAELHAQLDDRDDGQRDAPYEPSAWLGAAECA